MTGSVEGAKRVAGVEEKAVEPQTTSPADLLKKAVSGKAEPRIDAAPEAGEARSARRWAMPVDGRLAAVATVASVVGIAFGMVAAPRERSGEALGRIEAALEANHSDSGRLNADVERLSKALASLRETTEAARGEIRALAPALDERAARLEQALDRKLAALGDRVVQAERNQAAPMPVAAIEKQAASPAVAVATTASPTAPAPKAEPTQTASLADAKPKSETVEAWALRDVYQGIAILEDRRRRLLEVAPGDSIPGVGRIEAIERRGRNWVVVTRQGVITSQAW